MKKTNIQKACDCRFVLRSCGSRKFIFVSCVRKQMRACSAYGKCFVRGDTGTWLWGYSCVYGEPYKKYSRTWQSDGVPGKHVRSFYFGNCL